MNLSNMVIDEYHRIITSTKENGWCMQTKEMFFLQCITI